jgi:hypothetical protein
MSQRDGGGVDIGFVFSAGLPGVLRGEIGFVFSSAFWGVRQGPRGHGKSDYELRMEESPSAMKIKRVPRLRRATQDFARLRSRRLRSLRLRSGRAGQAG